MSEEKEIEVVRTPPKRLTTVLVIAIYIASRFVNWYWDLPKFTDGEQICWLLGFIAALLFDLWEAVMYDKTVVIKSIVVNVVKKGEEE